MKTKIKFDIWDFIDIDSVNDLVCEKVNNGVPSDISYCDMKITKNGTITMTADFEVVKFED